MKVYNSLTGRKEEFIPLEEGKVKMYVCGPTVYNFFHIGNARPFVVFDTLRRYFIWRGYEVKYVQNFTDVDDKIINRAREEGITAPEVSEKYIKEYFEDAKALNVLPADVHPKVSEHIDDIIDFVQTLIDKGYAYEADGDVYYSPRKFEGYGKLSGQNIDDLESGARIAIGEVKHDPLDFALWKAQKEPDEIAWKSPWGMGRPGWHIECSTMARKHLGPTIDIHGGGQDLKFPHHENEIAQSEACNGVPFAKYWMHNGYITIDGVKMSKSLNNFFTVRDIRKLYSGDVIRFFLLSGHYRSPINFSDVLMEQAKQGLNRIVTCVETLEHLEKNGTDDFSDADKEELKGLDKYRDMFIEAMDDDLNTADAISAIFEMVSDINVYVRNGASKIFAKEGIAHIKELTDVLGVMQHTEDEDSADPEIQALVDERQAARKEKNWAKADEIRDKLKEMGYTIKDTPQGAQLIKD
ncbi:MAG: cysteine--tRNA ligase [Eubacteriales bacterium]|uniref:cysteine--tRNA ligase n=1 Tax=Baileyella intestinalis TaxID=2606709 RepID=UPI0023F1E1B1|nr:cysteine--tRNA ligase [Baileyella intestinalis]MCI7685593.1 cysteine--tRNA ligase [Clostridiales bacterium]MDD5875628.1 cysteine--tRNA ligase [Baileyella intestinalis]MDY2994713.1 cysteine--tRNA ligase [Baileyella intestinalis]